MLTDAVDTRPSAGVEDEIAQIVAEFIRHDMICHEITQQSYISERDDALHTASLVRANQLLTKLTQVEIEDLDGAEAMVDLVKHVVNGAAGVGAAPVPEIAMILRAVAAWIEAAS